MSDTQLATIGNPHFNEPEAPTYEVEDTAIAGNQLIVYLYWTGPNAINQPRVLKWDMEIPEIEKFIKQLIDKKLS